MKILKLNFYLFVQNLLINSMNPKSLSKCNTCGSIGTIIEDNASGFLTCTNCGSIQGLTLSNEAAFTELSNGNSSKNGQFVASHSQKSNNLTTTASAIEGKSRIRAICESLPRLENQPEVCEQAERIFKRALHERFIRGRTVEIVSAACVYIAIRQKKTTGYLLVDVADHVTCGFFELAATALQLSKRVNENIPLIDPTLYVDRFTEELKFGQKSSEIKDSAVQLIRRMDRDWIQSGRKPSGVCGAAIMLAAAKYNITVSEEQILKCARVCIATINKRLKEIANTEFAKLSLKEIKDNPDLVENESNEVPPSMKIQKQLESIANEVSANDKKQSDSNVKMSRPVDLDETFDGEDLKDVDNLVLNEEEAETRSALFYALYKSKLDQMPKIQIPPKTKKKANDNKEDKKERNDDNTNIDDDDNDIVSDADEF